MAEITVSTSGAFEPHLTSMASQPSSPLNFLPLLWTGKYQRFRGKLCYRSTVHFYCKTSTRAMMKSYFLKWPWWDVQSSDSLPLFGTMCTFTWVNVNVMSLSSTSRSTSITVDPAPCRRGCKVKYLIIGACEDVQCRMFSMCYRSLPRYSVPALLDTHGTVDLFSSKSRSFS